MPIVFFSYYADLKPASAIKGAIVLKYESISVSMTFPSSTLMTYIICSLGLISPESQVVGICNIGHTMTLAVLPRENFYMLGAQKKGPELVAGLRRVLP